MNRSRRIMVPLAILGFAASAQAQVSIGPHGVRSGNTVVDGRGVHTGEVDVSGAGVRTHGEGGVAISTNNGRRSVDCHGGALAVDGNGNRLEVARCRSVAVNGNGNALAIRFDGPGRIAVAGNRNQVTWRAAPTVHVAVSNLGTRSTVTRAR